MSDLFLIVSRNVCRCAESLEPVEPVLACFTMKLIFSSLLVLVLGHISQSAHRTSHRHFNSLRHNVRGKHGGAVGQANVRIEFHFSVEI